LLELLDRYGVEQVRACIAELKDMADRHMRALLRDVPDGFYTGTAVLEDSGHGLGELSITAQVEIRGDEAHILIESPPQVPYFINSYAGNSVSGVYLGLMMFAQVPPPYNEGLYRCVSVDLGPPGTLCNAREPAPHVNSTTTPMETLADAVRQALEQAAPDRVTASWGHASGINIAGHDPRNGNDEYVTMVLASIISGAGANKAMDGWPACGPLCCFGALMSGDIELLEYAYPILIHRYSLMTDSGGAGEFRGGSGTRIEIEPLNHAMTVVGFGEGRQLPTSGAAGANNVLLEPKLGRLIHRKADGEEQSFIYNAQLTAQPGERVINVNPGGGGYGNPLRRPVASVVNDVRNGLVSRDGARLEYGVVIDSNGQVDDAATSACRAAN
jgi:N-methylhydantoinase B